VVFWGCSDSVVFWGCSDSVVFWGCSDSVVFFVFHFITHFSLRTAPKYHTVRTAPKSNIKFTERGYKIMSIFSSFAIKGMNILRIKVLMNLWITMLVIPNMTNKERLRYQGCSGAEPAYPSRAFEFILVL
jgi:hypothetical protein